ncbi:MAG: RnfABCDGE type electron transport complex subunit D [Chloroflexi bacterium]|nr:MAG: RnfABCDGE type electron transport complex subunit D [Chloroflexota bacterium]
MISTTMLHVRQLWRALHAVPQLLLVQPEQLSYDVVYALALVPPMATGIFFFRRSAALLIALCFLTGIVCLLALQLARLTINLPAWVGFRANHPLISGLIVACFLSPQTPAWLGVSLVLLLVVLDHVVWPQLGRTMVHPALVVFGILFVVQKQLPVGFVNPFDGRRLDDPLSLWHRLGLPIDPVKLYVGNVPGPIAATSAAAVLLGIAYLWYGRKISAAVLGGFLVGVAATAAAYGFDLAFQLASGPALFLTGYLAADRRRVIVPDQLAVVVGAGAGIATVVLRNFGQGQEATWQSWLAVGILITVALRLRAFLSTRPSLIPAGIRRLPLSSSSEPRRPQAAPIPARQPVMAVSSSSSLRRSSTPAPRRLYDTASDSNDMVRQMRSAAGRGPLRQAGTNPVLWTLALFLVNPIGLWLTWTNSSLSRRTKEIVSGVSALWYLAVAAGLFLVLTHGLHRA